MTQRFKKAPSGWSAGSKRYPTDSTGTTVPDEPVAGLKGPNTARVSRYTSPTCFKMVQNKHLTEVKQSASKRGSSCFQCVPWFGSSCFQYVRHPKYKSRHQKYKSRHPQIDILELIQAYISIYNIFGPVFSINVDPEIQRSFIFKIQLISWTISWIRQSQSGIFPRRISSHSQPRNLILWNRSGYFRISSWPHLISQIAVNVDPEIPHRGIPWDSTEIHIQVLIYFMK